MLFFKKRKKEKSLEKKFDEINENILTKRSRRDGHKVEHFVIERLEQIIEITKEIDEEKAEYRVVTAYLNDIHTIEELPEEEREEISDVARNIVSLNQARDEFLHTEHKITDAQYVQMQREEQEVPAAIKRLKANETYRDTVNKDMKNLTRERDKWQFYREDLTREQKTLQNAIYVVIGLAVSVAIIFFIFQLILEKSMQLAWTVLFFCVAVGICYVYLRILNARKEYKRADANANRSIVLLNQVKIKYVNITNAIDYCCEKYHVKDSGELNYIWQSYLEAVKQREKFERNNADLKYYSERLLRQLAAYRLYDAKVWVPQVLALVDHNEMVEITHNLNERRQKLRSSIEYNTEAIKNQKEDVLKMLWAVDKEMSPQIQEIIDAIDKLGGA